MKIRFFDPSKGYLKIKNKIDKKMQRVLADGDLILRSDVEKFEKRLARYVGTKYAVGVNSGTDALYMSLKLLGIGEGDEVLVPYYTFVASVQVIKLAGATPVFYDLDGMFEVTDKTKAIMPVHMEGALDINLPKLLRAAERHNLKVIEDAAQALGARMGGTDTASVFSKKAGNIGDIGCFSFYPAKILGAYGDAGALVTNDKAIYEEAKGMRDHYKPDYDKWGINSRMDNLQAAILNVKIKYLSDNLKRRDQIADIYYEGLNDLSIGLPAKTPGRVYQDFIIDTGHALKREDLYYFLKEQGIETMKNDYLFPISKVSLAQQHEVRTLRLPINEVLTDKEIEYIIKSIKNFYE